MRRIQIAVACGVVANFALALVLAAPAVAGHSTINHWPDSGSGRAVAYVVDFTGPNYPVGTKVTAWNQAYPQTGAQLNLLYRTSCSVVGHCAYVYEITGSNPAPCTSGDLGRTFRGVDSDDHLTNINAYFYNQNVNNQANVTEARNWVTCHELGHALRLNHRSETAKCMTAAYSSGAATVPGSHDYDDLAQMYGHND